MVISHPTLVLDACCLINLCVSGRLAELIQALQVPVSVSRVVWEQEVPTLRLVGVEPPSTAETAIKKGLLEVAEFQGSEVDTFVEFAAELGDDGEAATCAIAFERGWAVGTDDKAAIRFVERRSSHSQIITTPELVKHWADIAIPPPATVQEVLSKICDVGRYSPPRAHPLWPWWHAGLR